MANNDELKFEVVLDEKSYYELRSLVASTLLLCDRFPDMPASKQCRSVYQMLLRSLQHAKPLSLPFD